MNYFEAFLLAIVEGLTEFLPISSTGHMIICSALLNIKSTQFVNLYIVCIQMGAILSVVVLYHKRFFKSIDFYLKLLIAFVPIGIVGLLLKNYINSAFSNIIGISFALFLGGFVLLFVDKWFASNELDKEEDISFMSALIIGCFQCIAIFPGVSRSAATIIGGMKQKLTRKNAAEFSFFLAVPTMVAATAKKLYDFKKEGMSLDQNQILLLIFGNIIAFLVAVMAIKLFINMLNKNGFKVFGWYRISVGAILILLYLFKVPLSIL